MRWTRESVEKIGGRWAINIWTTNQRSIYIPNKDYYREYWPMVSSQRMAGSGGQLQMEWPGKMFWDSDKFKLRPKGQEGGTQICDKWRQGDKQVQSLQDRWLCHQARWEGGGGELSTWSTGEQVWLAGGEVKTKQNKCTAWLLWMPRKPTVEAWCDDSLSRSAWLASELPRTLVSRAWRYTSMPGEDIEGRKSHAECGHHHSMGWGAGWRRRRPAKGPHFFSLCFPSLHDVNVFPTCPPFHTKLNVLKLNQGASCFKWYMSGTLGTMIPQVTNTPKTGANQTPDQCELRWVFLLGIPLTPSPRQQPSSKSSLFIDLCSHPPYTLVACAQGFRNRLMPLS